MGNCFVPAFTERTILPQRMKAWMFLACTVCVSAFTVFRCYRPIITVPFRSRDVQRTDDDVLRHSLHAAILTWVLNLPANVWGCLGGENGVSSFSKPGVVFVVVIVYFWGGGSRGSLVTDINVTQIKSQEALL